jgi:hypothetical protein
VQLEATSNRAWQAAKSATSVRDRQQADERRADEKARYQALDAHKHQLQRQIGDIDGRVAALPREYAIAALARDRAERAWFRVEGQPWSESKQRMAEELIGALWGLYRLEERDEYLDEVRALKARLDDESPHYTCPRDFYKLPNGAVVDEAAMSAHAAVHGSAGLAVFAGKGKRILKSEAERLGLLKAEVTK